MNTHELAAGLENLAESDPAAFAKFSEALQTHQKAPEGRPKCEKSAVYPRGSLVPVMIWPVDRPGWLAEGATESLADAARVKSEIEAVAAPPKAEGGIVSGSDPAPRCELDLEELRDKWRAVNRGSKMPGRAGRDWFIKDLGLDKA